MLTLKRLLVVAVLLPGCAPTHGTFVCTALYEHECVHWEAQAPPPQPAPVQASAPPRECGINGVPCTPPSR